MEIYGEKERLGKLASTKKAIDVQVKMLNKLKTKPEMDTVSGIYRQLYKTYKPYYGAMSGYYPKGSKDLNRLRLIDELIKVKNHISITAKTDVNKIGDFISREFEESNEKPTLISQDLKDYSGSKFRKIKFIYDTTTLHGLYLAILDGLNRTEGDYGRPSHIAVYFTGDENKATARTLAKGSLINFNEFKKAIAALFVESVSGSDPMSFINDGYDLEMGTFILSFYNLMGFADCRNIIFDCEGFMYNCARSVLDYFKIPYNEGEDHPIYESLDGLIKYIDENNLEKKSYTIIANALHIKKEFNKLSYYNNNGFMVDGDGVKIDNNMNLLTSLDICEPVIIKKYIGDSKKTIIIIYDYNGKHFDICKDDKITLLNNIYINERHEIFKKMPDKSYKIVSTVRKVNSYLKDYRTSDTILKYMFFDYETVIDINNNCLMQEYSLSVLTIKADELYKFNKADEDKDQIKLDELRESYCKTFIGMDCSNQFIKHIIKEQIQSRIVFIGFNNANFDNLIFLNALLNYRSKNADEIDIENIQYNGNQLLDFTINGRHTVWDIRKIITESTLKDICKSFKLNLASKKEFSHAIPQEHFNNNKLMEYIKDNKELKDYNEYDVISTAVIFHRLQENIQNIPVCKNILNNKDLTSIKTVGSMIYKIFLEHNKNIKFPKLELKYYEDMGKYKIAGRVEQFNGKQEFNERIASMDVKSLYPYILAVSPAIFPVGRIEEVNEYIPGKIGFYYVDINQDNLINNNLPLIYCAKGELNDWEHKGWLRDYFINTVDIETLKEFGCQVIIKHGIIFTEHKDGTDLFTFLAEFMKLKNAQDDLKGKENYNPILRNLYKLLSNAVSGKIIEGLHEQKISTIKNEKDYLKIMKTSNKVNYINAIGDKVFVSHELKTESLINDQRPIYLGCLCYSYARQYMYRNAYSKVGRNKLIYTDTDSCKVLYKDFLAWKEYLKITPIPHNKKILEYDDKYRDAKLYGDIMVYGALEDEYGEDIDDLTPEELEALINKPDKTEAEIKMLKPDYYFCCLEKKTYIYTVNDTVIMKFKGVGKEAINIDIENNEHLKILQTNKKNELELIKDIKTIYNFYEKNKMSKQAKINMFKTIFEKNEAIILTSNFRRIVKNSNRNVYFKDDERSNEDMNSVKVGFSIKHIQLNKDK